MSILKNIIKGLKDPKNDGMDIEWLISDMEEIQSTFDGFESVKAYTEDLDADELVLKSGEYESLGKLIKALRNKITNG